MKIDRRTSRLLHERMTLVLVMFFCVFISSSEFFVEGNNKQEVAGIEQSSEKEEIPDEQNTFLHTAIDAVVPFVVGTVDQAFHLIYEILGFKVADYFSGFHVDLSYNQYFEVLFEHIISVNAP